jgi:hypothetical protein
MVKQTRFRVVLIGLALGFIEGISKVAFPTFPVVETFGFQAAIVGAYLTVKTYNNTRGVNNVRGVSEENGCEKPD